MFFNRFFHPGYAPIYVPAVLSFMGTVFFLAGDKMHLLLLLNDRWTLHYLLAATFIHAGAPHFLLNIMALHYIGGHMLLPLLKRWHFALLLTLGALSGHLVNNLLAAAPAIGISAGLTAVIACALYPYGRAPMKLLLIHDILRLPPFQFRYIVAFLVALDILGIIFGWHFFAHWAHLGGFAAGGLFGYLRFRRHLF